MAPDRFSFATSPTHSHPHEICVCRTRRLRSHFRFSSSTSENTSAAACPTSPQSRGLDSAQKGLLRTNSFCQSYWSTSERRVGSLQVMQYVLLFGGEPSSFLPTHERSHDLHDCRKGSNLFSWSHWSTSGAPAWQCPGSAVPSSLRLHAIFLSSLSLPSARGTRMAHVSQNGQSEVLVYVRASA